MVQSVHAFAPVHTRTAERDVTVASYSAAARIMRIRLVQVSHCRPNKIKSSLSDIVSVFLYSIPFRSEPPTTAMPFSSTVLYEFLRLVQSNLPWAARRSFHFSPDLTPSGLSSLAGRGFLPDRKWERTTFPHDTRFYDRHIFILFFLFSRFLFFSIFSIFFYFFLLLHKLLRAIHTKSTYYLRATPWCSIARTTLELSSKRLRRKLVTRVTRKPDGAYSALVVTPIGVPNTLVSMTHRILRITHHPNLRHTHKLVSVSFILVSAHDAHPIRNILERVFENVFYVRIDRIANYNVS